MPITDDSPTLDVLERLSAATDRMTFESLLRQLGLPEGVLRGRLRSLVDRGWVHAAPDDTYTIAVGALRPGSAYLLTDRTVRIAGPLMAQLRDRLSEAVRLVRLDPPGIVCIASREAPHDTIGSAVGRRMPAYVSASGKAILAGLPHERVVALLDHGVEAHTIDSVVDRAALFEELAETRARGWAYERGQFQPGVGCVAVSVPGTSDAISVGVPLARLTDDHAVEIAANLVRTTQDLGEALRR
ncbi:IclR family transcriptional regulator [Dactylosporangium sp. NBC_01737]|uniref:IclR family transcriptional regulator n=1 Tax=Dactylosporangium sp. NBC_01737 TaxID=2975959 RepID=UPI002E12C0D5|nr:IclR family transcriptional regulator [Dactylosporangium sp. NBC_01737]